MLEYCFIANFCDFIVRPEQIDFNRLAPGYDQHAILAQEAAGILVERLLCFKSLPERVLDLGCGTGFVTRYLYDLSDSMQIDALDCAAAMLDHLPKSQRIQALHGRAQAIDAPEAHYDAVLVNLLLPWCSSWSQVFQQIRRVLKPGGIVLISTLAPDCWLGNTDVITPYACWRDCPTMEAMADAMQSVAFEDVVADTLSLAFEFEDAEHVETSFLASGCLTEKPPIAMAQHCFDIHLTLVHAIKPLKEKSGSSEFFVPIEAITKR